MKHRIDLWYGSLVPIQYAVYSTHYTVYSAWSFIILRMAFAVAFTVGLTAGFSAPLPKPPLPLNFNPCGNQKGGGGGGRFRETKVTQDQLVFISRNKSGPRSWDTLAPPACGFLSWVTLWVTLWVTPLAYRSLASFNWRYGVQQVLLDIT